MSETTIHVYGPPDADPPSEHHEGARLCTEPPLPCDTEVVFHAEAKRSGLDWYCPVCGVSSGAQGSA